MLLDGEIWGKILVVVGATLFFVGTLLLGGGPTYQPILAVGWFFGAILFVVGLVFGCNLFTYSTLIGKLGVILICVSVVLGTTGLILYAFKDFSYHYLGETPVVRGTQKPNTYITEIRPYVWVFIPLAQVAFLLFVVGLLLELYDNVF